MPSSLLLCALAGRQHPRAHEPQPCAYHQQCRPGAAAPCWQRCSPVHAFTHARTQQAPPAGPCCQRRSLAMPACLHACMHTRTQHLPAPWPAAGGWGLSPCLQLCLHSCPSSDADTHPALPYPALPADHRLVCLHPALLPVERARGAAALQRPAAAGADARRRRERALPRRRPRARRTRRNPVASCAPKTRLGVEFML